MSFMPESALPELSPPVRAALSAGQPVVVLESTIISHGLPRPGNLAAARKFEEVLRAAGVTPATIAVVDGVPRAGPEAADLERIALDDPVVKVSPAGIGSAPWLAGTGTGCRQIQRKLWSLWHMRIGAGGRA